jgi:hypothetical protein
MGRKRVGHALKRASWRSYPWSRQLVREVDEQDRVLLDDPHEQDQAEHAVDVEALAAQPQRHQGPADAEGQREQDRERVG